MRPPKLNMEKVFEGWILVVRRIVTEQANAGLRESEATTCCEPSQVKKRVPSLPLTAQWQNF